MSELNPEDLSPVLNLIKAGEKPQARDMLLRFLDKFPDHEQAWVYMAACSASKSEFVISVQQALMLNPLNLQAKDLAEKYDIPLPQDALDEPNTKKRRRDRRIKNLPTQDSSTRRLRILLVLAILLLLPILLASFFLSGGEGDTEGDAIAAVTTAEADEIETADITQEATEEATEQATEEATEEATEQATEEVTQEATEQATEEATEEVAENTTPEVTPTSALSASEYVENIAVLGNLEDEPPSDKPFYAPDEMMILVLDLAAHAEALTLVVEAELEGEVVTLEETIEPSEAHTVTLPLEPDGAEWADGVWIVNSTLNGEALETLEFAVSVAVAAAPTETPTPTPEPTSTPEPTATPTEIPIDPTILIVYDEQWFILKNISDEEQDISGLSFVQQLDNEDEDNTERRFDVTFWGTGAGLDSIYQIQPESCMQTGISSGVASTIPQGCNRLARWVVASPGGQFWLPTFGSANEFQVLWNNETVLADCPLTSGDCEFALPANQSQ